MQDNNVALSDSLKAIAIVIEDIRHTMKETESKVKNIAAGFDKLEAELERQLSVQERTTREIQRLKNELAPVKEAMLTKEPDISTMKKNIPTAFSACSDAESLNSPIHTASSSKPESRAAEPVVYNIQKQDAGIPVMHGSGFSHVTLDYLKKLGAK